MHIKTVQIHWHEKQPIYSADFDPSDPNRLATAGGDNNVRIWRLVPDPASICNETRPQYVATLSRHIKQVNCVRFSPNGQYLASAGDGGTVILWKQSAAKPAGRTAIFGSTESDDEEDEKDGSGSVEFSEHWNPAQQFRASDVEDIYDLTWSPDSRFVLFGLTDHSIQIWDVTSGQRVKTAKDHTHFVQGVAWDPLGVFLATQSSDRSVKTWKVATKINGSVNLTALGKFARAPVTLVHPEHEISEETSEKMYSMFFDETLVSFFRRLSFSPDGSLLFMPTGLVPKGTEGEGVGRHSFYISTRGQLASCPGVVTSGFTRGVVAIRPHPRLFKARPIEHAPLFALPYRILYATASQDSVCIFDSTQTHPIAVFTNLHYGTLTDVAWSSDGRHLIAAATDGFASIVYINEGELGDMLKIEEQVRIIEDLKEKYAPGAIPKAASQAQPLDLLLTLNSEASIIPPTSELDLIASTLPPSPVINILPVKRKVVPSQAPPPSTLSTMLQDNSVQ